MEVECDEVEDRRGSEISLKGFAIKASVLEMEGEKTQFFLAGDRREVLLIKNEVGSVDCFGGKAQE